jgi:hypothetical protein
VRVSIAKFKLCTARDLFTERKSVEVAASDDDDSKEQTIAQSVISTTKLNTVSVDYSTFNKGLSP